MYESSEDTKLASILVVLRTMILISYAALIYI